MEQVYGVKQGEHVYVLRELISVTNIFFVNTCIIIAFIYMLNRLKTLRICKNGKNTLFTVCWHCMFVYALAAVMTMNYPIVLSEGWQTDMRVVPLVLAGYYGGLYTGIGASILAYLYRLWIGGAGVGAAAVYLFAGIFGAAAARWFPQMPRWKSYLGLILAGNGLSVLAYAYLFLFDRTRLVLFHNIWIPSMLLTSLCLILTGEVLNEKIQDNLRQELLERYAITDGLTGLFNNRYFQEQFNVLLAEAGERGKRCCIVMFDIDFFKQYNDAYGHPQGDALLEKIAGILKQNTRKSDLVARYGGEEFVVVLPGIGLGEGKKITERILTEIRQYSFFDGTAMHKGSVTISAGIACFPEDGENKVLLIGKADEALYRAKKAGRDRVVLYSAEETA